MKTIALILIAAGILGAQPAPRFEDYPAKGAFHGKNAPLVLSPADREFRTRLRDAAGKAPNFAAHYILTSWGCGGGCVMGAVIDANTGRVSRIPFTICCWDDERADFQPIAFRLDSRLVVFTGERNEKDGDNGSHFYEFADGRFVEIKSVLKTGKR